MILIDASENFKEKFTLLYRLRPISIIQTLLLCFRGIDIKRYLIIDPLLTKILRLHSVVYIYILVNLKAIVFFTTQFRLHTRIGIKTIHRYIVYIYNTLYRCLKYKYFYHNIYLGVLISFYPYDYITTRNTISGQT